MIRAGRPRSLGAAATAEVLRIAKGCPGAVIDSTWFAYSLPLVLELPGPFVEIRCRLDVEAALADRIRSLTCR